MKNFFIFIGIIIKGAVYSAMGAIGAMMLMLLYTVFMRFHPDKILQVISAFFFLWGLNVLYFNAKWFWRVHIK